LSPLLGSQTIALLLGSSRPPLDLGRIWSRVGTATGSPQYLHGFADGCDQLRAANLAHLGLYLPFFAWHAAAMDLRDGWAASHSTSSAIARSIRSGFTSECSWFQARSCARFQLTALMSGAGLGHVLALSERANNILAGVSRRSPAFRRG